MESSIAAVEVNLNWFWWRYYVGFDFFASRAILGYGSAEDHQAVFWHFFEEFEALRDLDDGVLNILSGGGGFNVGSGSVLVVEHGNRFTDLATGWHVEGDEFCSSALLRG